jgi:SAM-dependent methyltransferase
MNKNILDACCGSKMFWFNKNHPNTLYVDNRRKKYKLCDGRKLEIDPDMLMDFRDLKFENDTFNLVVFDPPHLKTLGENSWMAKKYGTLSDDWESDIKKGFDECWRVLKENGVLIFKWSESEINISEILKLIDYQPLFGHTTGRSGKTKWVCFMKIINL